MNTMDARDADPLLGAHRHQDNDDTSLEQQFQSHRAKGQQILSSRKKHFIVMSLVALDVVALLANVFIQLIACEMHQDDEHWVQVVVNCLEAVGLTISSLFMVELVACVYSYGMR